MIFYLGFLAGLLVAAVVLAGAAVEVRRRERRAQPVDTAGRLELLDLTVEEMR